MGCWNAAAPQPKKSAASPETIIIFNYFPVLFLPPSRPGDVVGICEQAAHTPPLPAMDAATAASVVVC